MSGGAGGIIILEDGDKPIHLEVYVNNSVPSDVVAALQSIQDRSVVHISFADKMKLFRILWKLLP